MWLHRMVGSGSTGAVFQASLEDDQNIRESAAPSYALKIVPTGSFQHRNGNIKRLRNEFEIYRKLSEVDADIAPRCYGLYESPRMLALVLDYRGESLTGLPWPTYSNADR